VLLSYSKDVTCDMSTGRVTVTCVIDGITTIIAVMSVLTLTAEHDTIVVHFKNPLRIDKNTNIKIGSVTYTAGLMSRTAVIMGYIDEVN